jgi:hypothetical protein
MSNALTDKERETLIHTAEDARNDPETAPTKADIIHACTHDLRHDPAKFREAWAIAMVWGNRDHLSLM